MGAVHELSKVTGSLEHRMDDLERSHETVAVRLTRLKRGGSIISNLSSSSGSDAASACEKIRHDKISGLGCVENQEKIVRTTSLCKFVPKYLFWVA